MTQFTDFGLNAAILAALTAKGYSEPTPIQKEAIPGVMSGRDLLGIAQTGTGKTAAFALPILHRLAANRKPAPRRGCRCLVLSPTRELATQIAESFRTYGAKLNLTVATIFGGVAHGPQRSALARGVDIVVAAPGRLLDHIGEGDCDLKNVEIFVLDEADQMLDMGFIVPIRQIVRFLPKVRQNLFFSATWPADIAKLSGELLNDPLRVSVAPPSTTVERVNQQVVFVEAGRKRPLLVEMFAREDFRRVLVFTRTKRGADKVTAILEGAGVAASAIHGNKSQNQRERALAEFKAGEVRALVATDIAARGIDISSVTHVVQYELPEVPESYVHRIGRTARAGAEGSAVAFCDLEERELLREIEKVTRQKIPSIDRRNDAELAKAAVSMPEVKTAARHIDPRRGERKPSRGGQRGKGERRDERRPARNDERRAEQRSEYRPERADEQTSQPVDMQAEGLGKSRRNGRRGRGKGPAPGWSGVDGGKPHSNGQSNGRSNGQSNGRSKAASNGRPDIRNGDRSNDRKSQGQKSSNNRQNAGKNGQKPQTRTDAAPRMDVMKVSGAPTGPMVSAAELMRRLSTLA